MTDFRLPGSQSRKLPEKQPKPELNWLEQASGYYRELQDRKTKAVVGDAVSSNPDQFAKARDASKSINAHWSLGERRSQEIQAEAAKREVWDKIKNTDHVKKAFEDPEFAKLAHDDAENLSVLEGLIKALPIAKKRTAAPWVKRLGGTVAAAPASASAAAGGVFATGFNTLSEFLGKPAAEARIIPEDPFARGREFFLESRRGAEAIAERMRGDLEDISVTERAALQGIESFAQTIPGLMASVLTGNPAFMLTWGGTLAGGEAGGKATEEGKPAAQALVYAASDAAIEVWMEMLPALKLLGDLKAGSSYFKTLMNQFITEVPQEQVATLGQDLNEWAVMNPERPFSDYINERGSAAYQTLIATMTGTAAQTTTAHVVSQAFGTFESDGKRARDAVRWKTKLDAVMEAETELAERAPDKLDPVLKDMLGEDADVYVDAKKFVEYFQSQEEMPEVPEVQEQLAEALAWRGDIRIPISDYITKFKDHHASLADIIRAAPEDMSVREAQDWESTQAEGLKKLAEEVDIAYKDDTEFQTSADQVQQVVKDQLMATERFPADVADTYAVLHRAWAVVQADKLGIQPHEVYERRGLTIQAEGVEGAQYAQAAETPAFKKWFGDSKVVDEKGAPQVVYHSTKRDFDEFKSNYLDELIFFTTNPKFAENWIRGTGGFRAPPAETKPFVEEIREYEKSMYNEIMRDDYNFDTDAGKSEYDEDRQKFKNAVIKKFGYRSYSDFEEIAGARLMPVYLSAQNPFNPKTDYKKVEQFLAKQGHGMDELVAKGIHKEGNWVVYESKSVIDELKRLGYDAIWLKESAITGAPQETIAVFKPTQIKSAVGNVGTFDVTKPSILAQEHFGSIKFDENQAIISLFENANLSTFLHESAHFFLESMRDFAQTSPEIAEDLNVLKKWFHKENPKWDGIIGEDQHEQFARGFESYLFEGKSPNLEMQGIFNRFRSWLVEVYKSLKQFNLLYRVNLTPEVRQVMDKMIATDAQIKETLLADQYLGLYKNQEDSGMTATAWAEYQALGAQREAGAMSELQTRSLRDMKWLTNAEHRALVKRQKEAKALRKAVKAEATEEVYAMPEYAARKFLTHGVTPAWKDIELDPVKLSIPAIKELYGDQEKPNWKKLGYGKYGMLAKKGVHPDEMATWFGFSSGDAMIQALLTTVKPEDMIEDLTDQMMMQRYGDITDPIALQRAAEEAVSNDAHLKLVATELRQANKAVGGRGILAKAAKAFAETAIGKKKVRHIKTAPYRAAEIRAAKAAEKAFIKGDRHAVAEHKRAQVLQVHFERAARDGVNYIEKSINYLNKFQRKGTRKALDIDYLDQIDVILDRFDLRKSVSGKTIERRKALLEWVEDQKEKGLEPIIDKHILNEARRQSYKDMTLDEFRGLVDSIKSIEHTARLKKKLLTAKDAREYNARIQEAKRSLELNHNREVPEHPTPSSVAGKVGKAGRGYAAEHRKFGSILREMDASRDGGVMWGLLGRGIIDAQTQVTEAKFAASDALSKLFDNVKVRTYPANMVDKKFKVPGVDISLTDEKRLMVALYWGEMGNRQRLRDGGVDGTQVRTESEIEKILDTLTKAEWDLIQGVWDYYETFRPAIAAQERRITGREPKWLDPAPIKTKYGVYKGGYAPAKYDSDLSTRSDMLANVTEMRQSMKGAFNSSSTRNSYTKDRAKEVKGRPLMLSFDAITMHINEVTHRLAWQNWLTDANRILKSLDSDIRKYYGQELLKEMQLTIKDISAGDSQDSGPFGRILDWLRQGSTIVGLGLNFTTAAIQVTGVAQSTARIGPKWMGKGLNEYKKNPVAATKFAYEHSPLMRRRMSTFQREVGEIMNKIRIGKTIPAIEATYFYAIGRMQQTVDVPTWIGAYHKGLEQEHYAFMVSESEREEVEDKAGRMADQAVKDSQSHGDVADLARIQRGHPFKKLWTNFYSYFSATYQLNVEAYRKTKFKDPVKAMEFIGALFVINILPVIIEMGIRQSLRPECDMDDLECWGKKYASEQVSFLFAQMIGLREFGSAVDWWSEHRYGYKGPAGIRFAGDVHNLGTQLSQMEMDMAAFKAANNVIGAVAHLPAGQINRTLEGGVAVENGEVRNIGIIQALLAGPPR